MSRLPRSVGPAIAAVVAKALEKNRERRFRDSNEFAAALTNLATPVLSAAPTAGPAPTTPIQTDPPRKTINPIVGSIVLLAILGGVWVLTHEKKGRPAGPAWRASAFRRSPTEPAPPPSPTALIPTPTPTVPIPTITATILPSPQAAAGPERSPPRRLKTPAPGARTPAIVPTKLLSAIPTALPAPVLNDEQSRQRLKTWMARPIEERARRARDIARWANKVAAEHPDAPDVERIKRELPALFKGETLGALERHRPFLTALFYRAYLSLDFAPADPELARRVRGAVALPTRTPK